VFSIAHRASIGVMFVSAEFGIFREDV